jgi:hypothetical protein
MATLSHVKASLEPRADDETFPIPFYFSFWVPANEHYKTDDTDQVILTEQLPGYGQMNTSTWKDWHEYKTTGAGREGKGDSGNSVQVGRVMFDRPTDEPRPIWVDDWRNGKHMAVSIESRDYRHGYQVLTWPFSVQITVTKDPAMNEHNELCWVWRWGLEAWDSDEEGKETVVPDEDTVAVVCEWTPSPFEWAPSSSTR